MTEADVDRLRSLGLTDAEILDVVLAAAVRCFFSKVLDGLGAEPDARYAQLDPEVRDALTVGRADRGGLSPCARSPTSSSTSPTAPRRG